MNQFCYTLSEYDYFELNKYHAFYSPESKKNMLIYRLFVAIIFVVCGLGIGIITDKPDISYSFYVAFGIVAVLWLIFFKWIMEKQIKKNIGKVKKSGKLYQGDVTISFENDFFVETTKDGEAEVKYSSIERVVMSGKAIYVYINAKQAITLPFTLFYLYINSEQAIVLPFTVFSDEQKRDDFIVFIEEKLVAVK